MGTESFRPRLEIAEFRITKAGADSKLVVDSAPWQSYQIRLLDEAGATFYFRENRLQEMHIGIMRDSTESWATWSMETESKRKSQHDEFLRTALGFPPYVFPWGEVFSVLDEKSAAASIIIRYSD